MAFAMVGEALISASVQTLLDRITSSEFRDYFANRKLNVSLLDELRIKLLSLNAVLNDAEEKQITDLAVRAWLDELKDAVLDAEDLLDEINTDSLRCKVEGESKTFLSSQVRSFLSSPFNQFYRSINSKLEAISTRLEHFVKHKDIIGLQSVSRRVSYRTVTDSLVESVVVAREDDKEKLLRMLLSDEDGNNNHIEVLTILGMGGLGKTTLAQCLYNDNAVQKHFDLTTWAWVSDDFDVFRVTKTIVESVTSKKIDSIDLDTLRVELKNNLRNKKFLLVLDDLWNEKYNDWNHLIAPFTSGKKGSKIIVTTRQHRVAQITHTFPICELKRLTDENCWCILAKHAFGNEGFNKYPMLEEIGRKIARKCDGLPLAAKTLGGLLRSVVDVEEWNRILNSNLWARDDVTPALRISYLHLPAHLKRCFAYCSIFPKQHLLDRKELILLWMAEGFLQQIHGEKSLESVGDECFNELLSRSLIEKDKAKAEQFRMHDLIYDLAKLVSGKSSYNFDGDEIPRTARHLAFPMKGFDVSKRFEGLYELKFVRTFLPQCPRVSHYYLTKKVSHGWLPKLRCLRTLSLSKYRNISELPNSIGNLVLLRYLDLSFTSIKKLPDATFTLYNLQTLKLANCKHLIQLPGEIANLVNLHHLDIRGTNLNEIPTQICKLQDLRTLTSFVVGREDGLSIKELRKFIFLQGNLSILKLQNIVDPMDAFQANMKKKKQIEELTLKWGKDPQDSKIEKDVLENLQPSTNLKKLTIRYYSGTSFPKWLSESSYSNVMFLHISYCKYCLSLPPFGQLPSLKELVIQRMKMVKIVGDEFYCNNERSPFFQPFPMLESLVFEEMLEWEEWLPFEGESSEFPFPLLKHLSLSQCPTLRGNLPSHLPSLKEVSISKCNQLEAKSCDLHWNTSIESLSISEGGKGLLSLLDEFSYEKLNIFIWDSLSCLPRMILGASCLQWLSLESIPSLISFPNDGLPTSLKSLDIRCCENLEFLSHETWHKYTSLESLEIRESCHSLTFITLDCFPALECLEITSCPNLEAITTQGGGAAPKLISVNVDDCEKLGSLLELIDLPSLKFLRLPKLAMVASLGARCFPSLLCLLFLLRVVGRQMLLTSC
ncbi:putative disease resistance protein At3g14460 isoform X2 [Cajanus cajan]|uniref:putative disease resistance protein At3g14460 isoform X2 n=1 Tax=Cajanus cajan TaxID=3821 RepID=UPI0010FB54A6|nr:putative disease resistance protein At3g14460 isoform X2 [Cajanus cajan]